MFCKTWDLQFCRGGVAQCSERSHINTPCRAAWQDIAAIEARNNRLERQARHNSALLEALEQLLDRLVLPQQTERVLATANFTYNMCA